MTTFADLQLIEPLCRALEKRKYTTPTPIQEASIPHLLSGGDLLGSAQTGTGKTASFALPILQHMFTTRKTPKKHEVGALVLTPTRELANQVMDSFRHYGRFTNTICSAVYGGVGYGPQIKALRAGVHVLVATPGRLLDLFEEGHLDLEHVQFLVIDEADRMLDMGFKNDLERIISEIPSERQTILFSATMPPEITRLSKKILTDPKRIDISNASLTAQNIDEQVMFVHRDNKNAQLFELLKDKDVERAIVFTRTKHTAEQLSKKLNTQKVSADAIHGDKRQNARQRSLARFRNGQVRVLVATDVAARGIDVDGITHVINYQLSDEPENYVHRIGRTARAGKSGTALTLCDPEDSNLLLGVERLLKRKIAINESITYYDAAVAARHLRANEPRGRKNSRSRNTYGKNERNNSELSGGRVQRRKSASSQSFRGGKKQYGNSNSRRVEAAHA